VEVLSKEPFDENTAAQLPWQLVKILSNPLCKDGPEVQKQLANILLNLRNFMVFYEHDALKYDLIKYPFIQTSALHALLCIYLKFAETKNFLEFTKIVLIYKK
jgi:hypothetical protein